MCEGPGIGAEGPAIGMREGPATGICWFSLVCTGIEGPAAAGKLLFGSRQRLP